MKLKRLWIDGFKNLNDFEIDFTDKEGVTILIGNNGSGKSNILEAISEICTVLYNKKISKFNYTLEYIYDDKDTLIEFNNNNTPKFKFLYNAKPVYKAYRNNYLPKNVIALYSGEESRLWETYYKPYFNTFVKSLKENKGYQGQKLFYVDADYWNHGLITLFYSQLDNSKNFIKEVLNIKVMNFITFEFNISAVKRYNDNVLKPFLNIINPNNLKIININLEKIYDITRDDEKYFFNKLISLTSLNLVTKITINFNDNLNTEDLSEGQKKQILIKVALDIIADEKSLILLDEPDASIHVSNKQKIKSLLDEYDNRNTILTTHSPTLTHHFSDNHITMIKDGQVEDRTKQEIISYISGGIWNYQEQSIFLSSTKDIILFVEGKHDKIHITEAFKRLKDEYPDLSFDIFSTDGATNLKQFAVGFANTDYDFEDKKIIAIFDDDQDGRSGMSKQNFEFIDEHKIITKLKANSNFFGFLLPKRDDFKAECTIENMYQPIKYKNAFKKATEKRMISDDFFTNKSIDKISKLIKDDAKNILADSCKDFDDNDFEHFTKLFELIKTIKDL